MKNFVTDNNRWISGINNQAIRADGTIVREGDEDAIENPNYGVTTEIETPDPPTVPEQLTSTKFHAMAGTVLGDSRLGDIINDLETASKSGGAARVAWQRYSAANAPLGLFVKTDVEMISAGMVLLTIMTEQERTDVLAAWPETTE